MSRIPAYGDYPLWAAALATRFPLALAEMRWPDPPRGLEATALANWGIECHSGWQFIIERMLMELEVAIAGRPPECRPDLRIVQMKEKFGGLRVYLAGDATPEMDRAIEDAVARSTTTCDVCAAPGRLAERQGWWATRCESHEDWTPDRLIRD